MAGFDFGSLFGGDVGKQDSIGGMFNDEFGTEIKDQTTFGSHLGEKTISEINTDGATQGKIGGGASKGAAAGAKGMGIASGAMDTFGTVMNTFEHVGEGTQDRMNERGGVTHDVNWGSNIASNTMSMSKLGGSIVPGWGHVIGAGVGAVTGVAASLIDEGNQPTEEEIKLTGDRYNMGNRIKTLRGEDTFAAQQVIAEDGMDMKNSKPVEVERDEIVLRKHGKMFKKVADFKGGKTHGQGGEDYMASEGDVIIPGKHRTKVQRMLKNRRWSGIESLRQSLPKDSDTAAAGLDLTGSVMEDKLNFIPTQQLASYKPTKLNSKAIDSFEKTARYAEGTSGVETGPSAIGDPAAIKAHIYKKLTTAGYTDIAAKGMIANIAAETDNFKAIEEYSKNVNGEKGLGIAQWSGSRRKDFETYLKNHNKDASDLDANIDFMLKEIDAGKHNTKGFSKEAMNKAKTVADSTALMLRGYERPHDQSDETVESRAKRVEDMDDIIAGIPVEPTPAEQEQEAIDQFSKTEEEKGYWTAQDGTGQLAAANTENMNRGVLGANLFNIGGRSMNALGDIQETFGFDRTMEEINTQEVGFHDEALAKEADDFITYLQHDADITWGIADVARAAGAIQNKILTGQSIEGGIPNAISEILSGEDPEKIELMLKDAQAKGVISEKGDYMIRDVVANPDQFWTSDMKTNLGFDVATLVANPKGLWSAGKGAVKLTKAGIKQIAKLKKLPGAAAKLGKSIAKDLDGSFKYKDAASLDELLAAGKELDKAGVKPPSGKSFTEMYSGVVDNVKKMPDAVRKKMTGNSFSDMQKVSDQMTEITGKTPAELRKMSKGDIGKLFTGKMDDAEAAVKASIENKKAKWNAYADVKKEFAAAQDNLKKVQKGIDDGTLSTDELVEAQRVVDEASKGISTATTDIQNLKDLEMKNWDEIGRLEGFMDDDLYKDKWRTLVKLEEGISRHVDNLEDIPEALKVAKDQQKSWSDGLSTAIANKQNVKGAVVDKATSLVDVAKANQKTALAEGRLGNLGIGQAKGRQAGLMARLEKYPGLADIVKKDAHIMDGIKKGTVTMAQIANLARERGGDAAEIDAFEIDPVEATSKGVADLSDTSIGGIDALKAPGSAIEGATKDIEGFQPVEILKKAPEAEVPAGDKKIDMQKIGSAAQKGLGMLADYMPAIYNIVKGAETPDKVARRFVTPQTRKYQSMAQPQLNAIDAAFEGSMANARNLSGGLMSNYRANTEAAWANKLTNQNKVGMQETQRADQIANQNIDINNQADQINTQTNQKADIMDMQSEAATNSFMAQGMQDIANIGNVRKKDAQAESNQNMILKMMETKNFDLNGLKQ